MPSRLKILNIVGARPQIIKSAAISRAISNHYSDSVCEIILHTGQHYDNEMSDVFFKELDIPHPNYNLNVGSASHGQQTAQMITGIEEVLITEKPEAVIIYGDTNSTLAAAVATSKIHLPLIHIEAGLRSYNKSMPEEVNRVMSDHVSTLLFAPTDSALKNLIKEGLRPENSPPFTIDNPKVFLSGDIMYDNSLYFSGIADKKLGPYLEDKGLEDGNFVLATIHRASNTDDPDVLEAIMGALRDISRQYKIKIVIPLHPRTVNALDACKDISIEELRSEGLINIIPPVSYLEMIHLEKHCKMIITDSGGVQKEAHFFSKPSIVLRDVTEWIELVENGNTLLAGSDKELILSSYKLLAEKQDLSYPAYYGDGHAAEFIMKEIMNLCRPD